MNYAHMVSDVWYLKAFRIFRGYATEKLEKVIGPRFRVRSCKRGQVIYVPGEVLGGVYFLITGRVKVQRLDSESGREVIAHIASPGEMLGISAFVQGCPPDTSAVAMHDSRIGFFEKVAVDQLMEDAVFRMRISEVLGQQVARARDRLEEVVAGNVPTRLARVITRLSQEFPVAGAGPIEIDVDLTQQDLANLIGATREITSSTLNVFKRNGWIDFSNRRIYVCNTTAMEQMAGRPMPHAKQNRMSSTVPPQRTTTSGK